jgi:hypothetical protein
MVQRSPRTFLRLLPTLLLCACSGPRAATLSPQEPYVPAAPAAKASPVVVDAQSPDLDPAVTAPAALLGVELGSRLASHEEVLALWRLWDEQSERVVVRAYGRTHEGRELVVGVVTSPANHARMDAIARDQGRLADPRGLADDERDALCRSTPAVAYLGCSIHGDETSGVDGGLALAHRLIAGRDADVQALLEDLVIVIDPCMNPDGRERFRAMVVQNAGLVPSLDTESASRGRWPWGRGNHFLFDMNRDWMAGLAPETRGRWSVLVGLLPQLFVDAHEMGAHDTFLFYPQAAPHNPALPARLAHWQQVFGARQAAAFDAHGWSYYTREWADAWGPFYSDAWGSLQGGVGMLYEQASYGGQSLLRGSGELATYREAVEHQAVAFLASLQALHEHREELLRDFSAHRASGLADPRACVIRPRAARGRMEWLARTLRAQGIEVWRTREELVLGEARGALGQVEADLRVPAGSLVVPAAQPASALVRSYLEFDVRIDDAALLEERRSLERKGESKMYDVTSWSLPHALDLDAWWCDAPAAQALEAWSPAPLSGGVEGQGGYGWIVDGAEDGSLAFAVRAFEAGLAVHASDEPFESAGRRFSRGSLLVRRHENGADAAARVEAAARAAGVAAVATASARAPGDGHDLGGGHFGLLERPRVALLSGGTIDPSEFGHLWRHLDGELGLSVSLLEATELARYDLRRFNVLVIPPGYGELGATLTANAAALRAWTAAGGTLIGVGSSAALLADEALDLSSVRRREDVLKELEAFEDVAQRQIAARDVRLDPSAVWGDTAAPKQAPEAEAKAPAGDDEAREREDAWRRRFMPSGATVRGLVDEVAWVTAGAGAELAVLAPRDAVLLSPAEVRCAVRLADEAALRVSGLLWPEARARLAHAAWLTVERRGNGQVLLFAAPPAFRGHHFATARLFANSVVLGPGLGARAPLPR